MKTCKHSRLSGVFAFFLFFSFSVMYLFIYSPGRMHSEFDDALMYCRYASNYLSGWGFSWNASEGAAFGITSPVYLFHITAVKSLLPFARNSSLLAHTSFAAGLLGLLVLVAAGYSYGRVSKSRDASLFIVPFCILSGMFRYHSFTGMETTLAFAANAFLVLSAVIHSRSGSVF